MHYASRGAAFAGQCAAAVALAGLVLYFPSRMGPPPAPLPLIEALTQAKGHLDRGVPIVLVNPVDVLPFDEQADPALRADVCFVADPDLALAHTGTNGIDLGYVRGEPFLRLRTRRASYQELTDGHARLYLAGKWQALSWLPAQLAHDGWTMRAIGGPPQAPLFEAIRPAQPARPGA
jgi:hypothetical protein